MNVSKVLVGQASCNHHADLHTALSVKKEQHMQLLEDLVQHLQLH